MFVGIGISFAYWFDFGMSYVGGSIAWRLPIAFQMLFAVVVIVLVFALPESPRWLFRHGREQEAIDILCALYDKDESDDYIVQERNAIVKAIEFEQESESSSSFLQLFKKDRIRTGYRVFLAWAVQFMNQAGGINLVVYYITSVLVQNVGMEARLAQVIGGCINMMFMIGGILPSLCLDRMGRRKTMIWGCSGLSISMLLVSALLSQADDPNRGHAYASGAVAFFFTYMLIFGMTMNCVPWVYVPEILPLQARTRGTAIGVSSNWLWNFTIVMITPIIINRLKWKAYMIFMATNLIFVPAIYFYYPETSNLRLEDIDDIFSQGGNPVTVARQMAKDMKMRKAGGISEHPESSKLSNSTEKVGVAAVEAV
jgi:MFS family permease